MSLKLTLSNQILITLSVILGSIALILACAGIGTPRWQITSVNTSSGFMYVTNTANFFYACRLNLAGEVLSCGERSSNQSISQYYALTIKGNQSELNLHLNTAAGFSILGILFIFLGTIATLAMFFGDKAEWIFLIAPTFLFVACLFMVAGIAEGSRVLLYNGYSANLYEAAQSLAICSFLISAIIGGRLFNPPLRTEYSTKK